LTLEPKEYMSETPEVFFNRCYDIRSGLLHGHDPLPSASDVTSRIPHLREFIADLILQRLNPQQDPVLGRTRHTQIRAVRSHADL
jgi:hypothetical protein